MEKRKRYEVKYEGKRVHRNKRGWRGADTGENQNCLKSVPEIVELIHATLNRFCWLLTID